MDSSLQIVQSILRVFDVIHAFDLDHQRMTLSVVAKRSGLSRATARRMLHTLMALGYVAEEDKFFSLRPKLLELGHKYLSSTTLPSLVSPYLKALTRRVEESSSVAILDGEDIVYIARMHMRRIMTVTITVGTRFPAYMTSMGRVMIAYMDIDQQAKFLDGIPFSDTARGYLRSRTLFETELSTIRTQGWALVDQELERGLRSLAAPIKDRYDNVVAAINVSTTVDRGSKEFIESLILPELLTTAQKISDEYRELREDLV